MRFSTIFLFALLVAACGPRGPSGGDALPLDAGPDATAGHDGGGTDAGPGTDGGPGTDAGPGHDGGPGTDAGPGTDGGTVPGQCAPGPCPTECFRAVTCVSVCGGPETSCGCCNCAPGSFDAIECTG